MLLNTALKCFDINASTLSLTFCSVFICFLCLLAAAARSRQLEKQAQVAEEISAAATLAEQKAQENYHSARAIHQARLRQKIEDSKANFQRLSQKQEQFANQRAEAILKLKASTTAAMNALKGENERRQKFYATREANRAAERAELEGGGQNADAIFAVRDEKLRQANRMRRIKQNIAEHSIVVAEQIEKEVAKQTAESVEKKKEEMMIERYWKSLGRSVLDQKIGELRRKKERKLQREQQILAEQSAPKQQNYMFDDYQSAFADLEEKEQPPVLTESKSLLFPPIHRPSSSPSVSASTNQSIENDSKKHYPIAGNRYRIALAQKKVAQGLQKQKEQLAVGSKKIVCGKQYANNAFLPSPAVLEFVDFVPGRVYSQTLQLTNVSLSFDHFHLLQLSESMREVFEIEYIPVGRMSAGSVAKMKGKTIQYLV